MAILFKQILVGGDIIMNSAPISQIRLIMEYKSFPMWLCDEDGLKVSEGIVPELQNDMWLKQELVQVQDIYDGLFIDSETEFAFRGFSSVAEEATFYARLQAIAKYICRYVEKKYIVRNNFGRQEDGSSVRRQGEDRGRQGDGSSVLTKPRKGDDIPQNSEMGK